MKKIIIILSVVLTAAYAASAQQLDSLTRVRLSDKLEEYFEAIMALDVEAQKQEADFLIKTAQDSLVRQYVAVRVYDHYLSSPVMGAEAVAIHVLDKWFMDGTVRMYDDIDLLNARIFADFNRSSLIGQPAPELVLLSPAGDSVKLYSGPCDRYSVLYFYDTDCSKCKLESMRLNAAFADKSYPVDFHAVYTGDNYDRWQEYMGANLKFPSQSISHFWDPELDSDFQRKYGILQTPRMFLISPDGTILGRGLDTPALVQMLEEAFAEKKLEYGGAESQELFGRLLGQEPSAEDVAEIADLLEDATLDKGDTLMFRQLMGDYLYYLASRTGHAYREGLKSHIDRNILGRPEVWVSQDDKLKVVGFAEIMSDLLSKAEVGTLIPDIKVQGVLLRGDRDVARKKNLRRLRKNANYIIFHTEGCNVCAAEIEAAHRLASESRDAQFYLINVDDMMLDSPALAGRLFDLFDLSSLPYIVVTDKKGVIQSRYVTLLN